jgi:hypothetical protein
MYLVLIHRPLAPTPPVLSGLYAATGGCSPRVTTRTCACPVAAAAARGKQPVGLATPPASVTMVGRFSLADPRLRGPSITQAGSTVQPLRAHGLLARGPASPRTDGTPRPGQPGLCGVGSGQWAVGTWALGPLLPFPSSSSVPPTLALGETSCPVPDPVELLLLLLLPPLLGPKHPPGWSSSGAT